MCVFVCACFRYIAVVMINSTFDLRQFGQLNYAFVYNNDKFRLMEAGVRMTFLAMTIVLLATYLGTLRHWPITKWLPEQKWVVMLLASLILFLNPLFIPLLYVPDYVTEFFATLCSTTALTVMLVFWLLMMDGLRSRSHPFCSFYLPKVWDSHLTFFYASC